MTTQPPKSFWDDAVNTGEDLFSKIKSSLMSAPPAISIPKTPAPSKGMVFNVGEGLDPSQTKTAYQKISQPDYEIDRADSNSFWGTAKNTASGIFQPTESKVRLPFQVEPSTFNAPPIVTEPAKFGYSLLEAIPKFVATLGGEFKAGFKPTDVKANIDLRRLGFETPDYQTASKEFTDAINKGADPFSTGLGIVSKKTLDLAFGAGLLSDAAALSTRVLLSGGPEARIEAQNVIDAYKQNQKEVFAKVKDAPLDVREKVLSDLANTKNQAEKVLADQGAPSSSDRVRVNMARYTDILARNTEVTKSFWSDFSKPNIRPNYNIPSPYVDPLQLPGSRPVNPDAVPVGLSTQEVESVGRLPDINPKQDTPLSFGEAAPIAEKASDLHYNAVVLPAIKANLGAYIGGDNVKEYFGQDYNENNHPVYSQTAFKEYQKALTDNPNPEVVLTGGGPASGKTEILVNQGLKKSGFNGISYDSNMSNYDGAVKSIELARDAGKKVIVQGILPNLERARIFSHIREIETGRGISDKTFARGHAGFPATIIKLLENGIISPDELRLYDMRNVKTLSQATDLVAGNGHVDNPIATLKKLGYNESDLIKNYGKEKYKQEAVGRAADSARERAGTAPGENRSVGGQGDGQGDRGRLLGVQEKNTVKGVEQAVARAKAGEVFGPRTNKVKVSDEGIPLARTPKARRLDKTAIEKLVKNSDAVRAYQTSVKQIGEVLKGRSLQPPQDTGGQTLGEDQEPFPSSSNSLADSNRSPSIESVADAMENVKPPIGRGGVTPPKMDFLKWNDKAAITLSRETMERNIEDIAGEDAPKLKEYLVNKVRENETARVEFLNKLRAEARKKIVTDLGIKAKSEESKLVQQFGERQFGQNVKDNIDNLQMRRPNDWYNIKEGAEYIRSLYDDLLDKVNAERKKFGYEPIPKHEDYFRHFHEMDSTIKNFGLIIREQDLPTEIAGMTGIFNPGKPFSTAEMRRRGELGSTEDAVSGLDNYLDSISKQIYHIDSIQRGRTVEKYIREAAKAVAQYTSVPSEQIRLPNFVSNVHDYANMLAGKKAQFDRAFESVFGRRVYTVVNWVRGRVAANMIAGNVSSAITNFIPFTQSLATTSKPAAIHGITDALTAPFKDNFAEVGGIKSDFLTRRFPDKAIDLRGLKSVSEKLNWMFEAVDKFTAKSVVSGKYYEGINKGLSPETAIAEADNYAGRVLADRSFGQLPNLFNTRTLGFFTQFQTEVNNMYSFMTKDIPRYSEGSKTKMISSLGQFILYSYLFNQAYQKVTGRRPTIDPIYAGLTLLGMTNTGGDDFQSRLWATTQDLGGNLPFTGLILQGGRLPVSAGVPDFVGLLKGQANLTKELLKPAFYVAPPFAGGQIKKTIEGAGAIREGAVFSPAGNFQYQAPTGTMGKIQSLLFGKYASEAAQNYFNRQNINSKIQAPIQKIYDQVQKLKASGDTEAAQKIVDGLNDEDYDVYKKIRTNAKRADTMGAERDMVKTVTRVNSLVSAGKSDEAQAIVDDMTDEEYRIYQLTKKKIK